LLHGADLTQEYESWRKGSVAPWGRPNSRDTYLIPRPQTDSKWEIERKEVKRWSVALWGRPNSRDTYLIPRTQTDAKWEIEKREMKRDGVEETPI